jgi:hypothetical protein
MKVFGILLTLIAAATVSTAQTAATANNPVDVQVVKASWSKTAHRGYLSDSSSPTVTVKREHRNVPISNAPDARVPFPGMIPYTPNVRTITFPPTERTVKGYLYEARVRNTGTKKIKALDWEYVFADAFDGSVVARHRFHSPVRMAPGKEAKLSEFAVAAPTKVVNAKAIEQNPDAPYAEQVRITRIEYADGSVWIRPAQKLQ